MSKERKGKIMPFSIGLKQYKKLKEMSEHWDVSAAEVIRRALDVLYENLQRHRFGYKGADAMKAKLGRQEAESKREGQIAELRTMDAETLTAFLIDSGYIENPEYEQGNKIVRIVAELNEGGMMALRQRFYDKGSNEFSYASDLQTLDEVIKGLIKEKKI